MNPSTNAVRCRAFPPHSTCSDPFHTTEKACVEGARAGFCEGQETDDAFGTRDIVSRKAACMAAGRVWIQGAAADAVHGPGHWGEDSFGNTTGWTRTLIDAPLRASNTGIKLDSIQSVGEPTMEESPAIGFDVRSAPGLVFHQAGAEVSPDEFLDTYLHTPRIRKAIEGALAPLGSLVPPRLRTYAPRARVVLGRNLVACDIAPHPAIVEGDEVIPHLDLPDNTVVRAPNFFVSAFLSMPRRFFCFWCFDYFSAAPSVRS